MNDNSNDPTTATDCAANSPRLLDGHGVRLAFLLRPVPGAADRFAILAPRLLSQRHSVAHDIDAQPAKKCARCELHAAEIPTAPHWLKTNSASVTTATARKRWLRDRDSLSA